MQLIIGNNIKCSYYYNFLKIKNIIIIKAILIINKFNNKNLNYK